MSLLTILQSGSLYTIIPIMALYVLVLLFVIHFFRNNYKIALWFWAASLLTFPIWIASGNVIGWFRWFKILSVILPTIVVCITRVSVQENKQGRFWSFFSSKKFLWFFYCILFLNILEATIKDVELGNYYNALAGVLLCITIPFAPRFWGFTKGDGKADLYAYTTVGWNFLYTTWNLCFTFGEAGEFGPHFAGSLCILLAAELYPLIVRRPELYITARAYTLAAHLLLRACYDFFPTWMNSAGWFNEELWQQWGLINFILSLPFLFWYLWQLQTGRSAVSFRRGVAREEYIKKNPNWKDKLYID